MPTGSVVSSLVWFIVILALIPAALWLLRRSPVGGAAARGLMRTVAVLPLAPNQRLVTVEVGRGDTRRWLVLGVSSQGISTLHEMAPQDEGFNPPQTTAPFSLLLARLQHKAKDDDAR